MQPSGSIRLSDVQALLLWALADGVSLKWAFIEARRCANVFLHARSASAAMASQLQTCQCMQAEDPKTQSPHVSWVLRCPAAMYCSR